MTQRLPRLRTIALGLSAAALALTGTADAQQKKPPYWASISAGKARMRTGPGRQYPASWLYQRADLPVKVLDVFETWRKVEDPDGTQGWMLVNLMSSTRTGYVKGAELPMHESASPSARVLWRAAPGVVGRVSQCARGWCKFDVRGRAGYVEASGLWGVDGDEVLP